MIIVDRALEQREREGNPIRVALVGAGFMGRGIALQIVTATPGMDLVESEIQCTTRLEELGMGLLLGVARGSVEPPRLLVARYEPPAAAKSPVLARVGKWDGHGA